MTMPDGFRQAAGTRNPAARQLDGSSRMSARYQVRIVTERAEREYAKVESAIAAFRQLAAENRRPQTRMNPNSAANASGRTRVRGRGGRSYDNSSMLAMNLETNVQNIQGRVEAIFADGMQFGVQLVQIALEMAVTGWGEYRFSRGQGRSAGREDKGNMVDAVTWNVSKTSWNTLPDRRSGERLGTKFDKGKRTTAISGYFGWDNPPVQVIAQEKGFRHARGSSGSFERKTSRMVSTSADTSLYVEGALSLGRSMVTVRDNIVLQLRQMRGRYGSPRARGARKK